MTTLIQQKSGNDCVLASIAMLVGKEKWEDVWTDEDLQKVIEAQGVSNHEDWLARVGIKEHRHYISIYTSHQQMSYVYAMLRWRKALLTVNSLNHHGGHHMVYWDGETLFDPQDGVEGRTAFKWLTSCVISRVFIFNEASLP